MVEEMEESSSSSSHGGVLTQRPATTMSRRAEGGLITMPFIIGNEGLRRMAYGVQPIMILYLLRDYNMGLAKATSILFIFTTVTNFMPLLGAFVSDSYLGRFLTIGLGSISSLLGIILLWLTAMIPEVRPPPCSQLTQICTNSATSAQVVMLLSSFALMSIGAGSIKPCSIAFGADQLDKRANPNNQNVLESFFSWYYASTAVSDLLAFTVIPYIKDRYGWKIGLGVPAILMLLSTCLFLIAYSLYIKRKVHKSFLTDLVQVIVVSYKNRNVPFRPANSGCDQYHHEKDSQFVIPTNKLRFLNKACIIRKPEQDLAPDGSASNPWSLCTVQKVEELKAVIKVLPVWSACIMLSINTTSQGPFPVLQASSMDRHLTSNFQVPAASFSLFIIIVVIIWIFLYDRAILPLASKIQGKPVRLGVKLRMGIGLFFSCIAMVVSGIVEYVRRRKAIQEGYLNNPRAVLNMSAMWLIPQHCLTGLAEAFTAIGQMEFYYSEMPKTMSSIAGSLVGIGMGVGSLLASAIFNAVDKYTTSSRGGKGSWVSSNINGVHFEYYYWLLAIMSFVNLLYFVLCSWIYGPCVDQVAKVAPGDNEFTEEAELPCLEMNRDPESRELEERVVPKV